MPTRQTDTFHLNLDSHTLLRFNTRLALFSNAQVAQSVEQRIENPRVGGSIPPLGTILSQLLRFRLLNDSASRCKILVSFRNNPQVSKGFSWKNQGARVIDSYTS